MEELKSKIELMLNLMGFNNTDVGLDVGLNKVSIKIEDEVINSSNLPQFVASLNAITRLLAKKMELGPVVVDINNYRKDRERIIVDLAKEAARKAVATKESVSLPAMNAYERRLVHTELSMRPDIKTESMGEGRGRYVIIKNTD
ncbi:MAG TPA: R3H domain-containing nucleic acid-binding protein [Candidatus Paceibacterota bacterium]